jgi:hypothetical protein
MRNFRQALASPHSVHFHRVGAALATPNPWEDSMRRFLLLAVLIGVTSGCAMSLRSPNIVDIKKHPGRYNDHTVSVNGVVTSSWGVPLVPFRFYKVDDGSGEITVLSQSSRMPSTGERVRVKGKVQDVAMLGGRAVGLHLREEDLYVKR